MRNRRRLAPAFALPLLLVACYDDDYDDCWTCDDAIVHESEINDTAPQANWLGVLHPGQALSIRGHITQHGPDFFDGFAFVTGAPLQVDMELWADFLGADLDLCVWDPVFGAFVACFETAAHPETGQVVILEAGKEFHLVVRSFHGNSAYWLDVFASAAVYGALATESTPEQRTPGAWEGYRPSAEARAEVAPGRPALLLDVAADGGVLAAQPARIAALDGRR